MEKRELEYTAGRNVNLAQSLCKTVWSFLKKQTKNRVAT